MFNNAGLDYNNNVAKVVTVKGLFTIIMCTLVPQYSTHRRV